MMERVIGQASHTIVKYLIHCLIMTWIMLLDILIVPCNRSWANYSVQLTWHILITSSIYV